jgi:hypothetical protein
MFTITKQVHASVDQERREKITSPETNVERNITSRRCMMYASRIEIQMRILTG